MNIRRHDGMKLDERVLLGRLYERSSQNDPTGGKKSPQVAQEREGPTKMTPEPRKRPKATSGPGKGKKHHLGFNRRVRVIWREGTHGT